MTDLRRWPHADRLLDEALALPRGERVAFVERAADGDAELARALERVLREAEEGDGFLTPGGALSGEVGRDVRAALTEAAPAPALSPGTRIEHYEVIALIGRGGMGEVYRARDLRLQREVALKVLPQALARDHDRRARLRREARVLAMLSHPGIAAIHGVAESEDVDALVLELVDGPTLEERLHHGPLALGEALTLTRHLVDAVAAAHARGILHRDLKPANIKVLANGTIKVLDFGLAKALTVEPSGHDQDLSAAAPHVLLGTAAYMSPEQVRGQAVDARADIWACGCIIFEMLTGTRAFAGDSVQETLARVVEREPAFSLLSSSTPPSLRRLLRRTLEKDPARRLGYIGDARLELEDAASEDVNEAPAVERPRGRLVAAAIAGALLVGGAIGALVASGAGRAAPAPVSQFIMPLGPGEAPVTGFQPMLALSPDGRTLVYRARRDGVTRLYRRDLDRLEASPIAGTENGTGPFFSPDGVWLGFDSDGVLKRISMAGGLPVEIGPAPGGVTATWMPDDTIVYATNTSRTLQRVRASGGTPESLTSLDADRGDTLHLLPQALADGRRVLFTIAAGRARHIALLDLPTGQVRVIAEGTSGRLVGERLVFARDGVLWSADVDARTLAVSGVAAPVIEGIEHTDNTVLHFAAAEDGSIAYLPAGQNVPAMQQLVWLDRGGRETPAGVDPGPYTRVSLSPDGSRFALAMTDRGNADIWIADPGRKTMSRLTMEPTIETMPTWSPGGRVAFRSEREGPGIFQRDWQGAGPVERLTATDGPIHSPYSWTPDGKTLLFALFRSFNRQAIASVTPPDATVHVLLDGDYAQIDPQVSPDGRFMAYQSDETGRFEVYVRPYPEVHHGRWPISTGGGTSPRWSRDGRELFFYDGAALVSVPIAFEGARLAAGRPSRLIERDVFGGRFGPDYEIAPDGRFLFIVPGPPVQPRDAFVVFVQNWAR